MVSAASEVIAIVDRTKWERAAFATFCPTDRISLVLTDDGASEAMVGDLRARGVDVRLVGLDGSAEPVSSAGRDAPGSAP
jgi:DeoR/GlpR family transcriptional regulator of sugar metabolism